MTGGGAVSPPIGASPPAGTGDVPDTPGVNPVLAGAAGVGLAVGSWVPLAALATAVVIVAAAAGRSERETGGRVGSPADLACAGGWCCTEDCVPFPAGVVPDAGELVLGGVGVLEGLAFPATRFDRVGFTGALGIAGALGVPGVLGNSTVGVLVARGISGSWWGSTAGLCPVLKATTCAAACGCSTLGVRGTLT
ncbi:hypothetical protein [Mycobacteroides abscessus]|uniref:hypothetical protein n=1 Tax=Mycobacteroides abscessus TaxID=36809 RepID=UPI001F42FA61|nr:hypothetical protein [Mycobacteroides abscessus]